MRLSRIGLLLAICCLPSAWALNDDFEDDTNGANPVDAEYTYSESGANGRVVSTTAPHPGTSTKEFYCTTSATSHHCDFDALDWSPCAAGGISLFFRTSDNSDLDISLEVQAANGTTLFGLYNDGLVYWVDQSTNSFAEVFEDWGAGISINTWYYANWTWNCQTNDTCVELLTANLATVVKNVCATDVRSDKTSVKNYVAALAANSPSYTLAIVSKESTSRTMAIDEINSEINITAAEVIPEPPDFDSGLLEAITGLGFITPESQFFFAIIAVGITTVATGVLLKFMAPGRLKVLLIQVAAMLVGIFCVLLAMFDLWMFVVAAVLAGTILKGSQEARNTWAQMRSQLAARGDVFEDRLDAAPDPFYAQVLQDQATEKATQATEAEGEP
jgi:hypothetical protein